MPNGKMLDELRKLAEKSGDISPDVATRLILSSLAELYDVITCSVDANERMEEHYEKITDELQRGIGDMKKETGEIIKIIEEVKTEMIKIKKNPFIAFGEHLQKHPKLAILYGVMFLVTLNLWFVSGFRRPILLLLGVPEAVIDILAP